MHTLSEPLKGSVYISLFAYIHFPLPGSHYGSCFISTSSVLNPLLGKELISTSPAALHAIFKIQQIFVTFN